MSNISSRYLLNKKYHHMQTSLTSFQLAVALNSFPHASCLMSSCPCVVDDSPPAAPTSPRGSKSCENFSFFKFYNYLKWVNLYDAATTQFYDYMCCCLFSSWYLHEVEQHHISLSTYWTAVGIGCKHVSHQESALLKASQSDRKQINHSIFFSTGCDAD